MVWIYLVILLGQSVYVGYFAGDVHHPAIGWAIAVAFIAVNLFHSYKFVKAMDSEGQSSFIWRKEPWKFQWWLFAIVVVGIMISGAETVRT